MSKSLGSAEGPLFKWALVLFDESRRNVSISTIKILCDELDITLKEFFSSEIFEDLEQEIE